MTDQIEMPDESTAPRGAGPQLRFAREKLGLSVADVAARTRISQRHIEDLEAGTFAAFSSRTYAIGFSRTVAKTLGLDPEAIATQVRAELSALQPPERTSAHYETSDPARVPSRPLVWFSVVAAALLLAGLFVAYRTLFSPAAELPSLVEQEEAEQAAAAAAASPAATPAASATPARGAPVVFTAMDDRIWVRLSDANGVRLFEKELVRGESFTVPAEATTPMINTARPEALAITVGGRAVPPLATEMATISGVRVDAATLLARPAATVGPATSPAPVASPTPAASPAPRNIAAPLRRVPLSQTVVASTGQRSTGQRSAVQRQAPRAVSRPAAASPAGPQDAAAANAAAAAALQQAEAATSETPPAPAPGDGGAAPAE